MPILQIEITDIAAKGITLATAAFNTEETASALSRKEEFTPLIGEEYAAIRINGMAESWYHQHARVRVEPLKEKIDKLTDIQRADIEARLKAYVPDVPDVVKVDAVAEEVK